jgi:acyl-homoserine-lactone acylase
MSSRTQGRIRSLNALVVATAVAGSLAAPASAGPGGLTTQPEDGFREATIHRTSFGIPHIVADDLESLGFGHAYATAEDAICVLADTMVTGRGERSRYFGPDDRYVDQVTLNATNLQTDVLFTNIRDRGIVEELLADEEQGPSQETRALVSGYVAGLNRYLADIGGADGITDPQCAGGAWVQPADELDLWHGIYAANLLASAGVFVPQIADASPPTLDDLGLPLGLGLPTASFAAVPEVLPTSEELLEGLGKGEHGFGSNGTALGGDATVTGQGMVLGNPHFPWRGRYRFSQAHLTIPGEYNVAGGMLLGAPVVNIGWNDDVAWTHTVSTAYRFTPYEYRSLAFEGLPLHYLTTEGPKELDRQEVEVTVLRGDGSLETVVEDVYRTDEGYVIDAPALLMGWTPVSFFALREANAEHLRTLDAFHEMSKATDVEELLDAHLRTGGIPWVNTMAADRHGDALYADASVVPHVTDEMVLRCATPIGLALFQLAGLPALDGTRASADCAWGSDADAARPGIFGRENLPHAFRRDWVVNANDSHWLPNPDERLEGFARIIGCERCVRSLRTRMVYRYVMDRLDGSDGRGGPDLFSHEQLQEIQHENRVFAGELSRENDDLATVCAAADGGRACDVLAAWDGTNNTDSVGAHLFREFFLRTPGADRWEEGFDPNRPVDTPRDLDESADSVVAAMRNAIAFLENRGIALDARLGDLQVAAYDHARRIPIGGGPGSTGDANVVATSNPAANRDARYPISFGSSHMQAVAFTDEGPQAATMLSYGLATDPTRPNFGDQTELFSEGRWVEFPWTPEEIAADENLVTYVVTERPDTAGGDDQSGRPDAPGRSGDAPGRSGDAPGRSGDAPGRSGEVADTAVLASASGSAATWSTTLAVLALTLAATLVARRRVVSRGRQRRT